MRGEFGQRIEESGDFPDSSALDRAISRGA
jgi:hypothetical protein